MQDDNLIQAIPAQTIAEAHLLGVDVVRANVFWGQLAPDPASAKPPRFDAGNPAAYPAGAWKQYDAIARDAAADGVRIDFTITGPPPRWAAGAAMPATSNCPCRQWRPSPADFRLFVHALGERYSGDYTPPRSRRRLPRVSFWSIWNEPNYGPNLAPQTIDNSRVEVAPQLYRHLLDGAWSALEATGHTPATDTILIGETAPRGQSGRAYPSGTYPGSFAGMVPLRFVRALYCVSGSFAPLAGEAAAERGCPATAAARARFIARNPALFDASGWADHPYPDSLPPTVATNVPGYADYADLGNLTHTLDRSAAAYGSHRRLPIYSTEFGYKTDPPYLGGVPPQTAARYLNQSEYLSWRDPRIRSYDQYLIVDPAHGSGSQFATGLQFADGKAKPGVLDSFRMPLWLPRTDASSGTPLEVWGCARGAPDALTGKPERVAIQFAPRGPGQPRQRFDTLHEVELSHHGGCYFDVHVRFPATGSVRLAWASPGGPLYSRVQAISIH